MTLDGRLRSTATVADAITLGLTYSILLHFVVMTQITVSPFVQKWCQVKERTLASLTLTTVWIRRFEPRDIQWYSICDGKVGLEGKAVFS